MKITFPQNFLWGAAASGPQTEGNINKKNENIWDLWYQKNPEIFHDQISSSVVTNTYENYQNDTKLMKDINMNSFRTSIQWVRLIDDIELNTINKDAVNFYNNYFDSLIENGITPIVGLFHFDMPAILQEKYNGWESEKVISLFVEYAKICFDLFGHKIKIWSTFNEPLVIVEGQYLYQFHYPCEVNVKKAIQVAYNILLAHTRCVNEFKKICDGEIGIILALTPTYAKSNNEDDLKAKEYADLFFNKSYMDPIILGTIPQKMIELFKENNMLPNYQKSDLDNILKTEVDFVGLNYYVPRRVQKPLKITKEFNLENYFSSYINPEGRFNPYRDNNEIYPKAIYDIAIDMKNNYHNKKWYLAEIGIAMNLESEGEPIDNLIIDDFRISLLKEHFIQLQKAIEEGSNCFGIHMWTFIDNWSWCNSHKRRYGFYRLDLKTKKRILKKSGLFFKELSEKGYFHDL